MSEPVAAEMLSDFIERIENLEGEKKAIADDISDIYAEAKSQGFDTRTMREVVKLRKLEKHVRDEREALLETYKAALGLDYCSTPLGSAALNRAQGSPDVVKLAADIHAAGGRMVGGTLVMPMDGLKSRAESRIA